MPIKKILKDLYIAQSIEELVKRADDKKYILSASQTIKNLIRCAIKLYDEAKKSSAEGDEERSYILFTRFFESIKVIKKSNDFKKEEKFFNEMIGLSKLKETIDSLETLSISLAKRYSDLKESQELRAKENSKLINETNDTNNKLETNSIKTNQSESNENSYPLIDCQQLVDNIENSTEITKILIFDTRSVEEYEESHIERLKTTATKDITIANIPNNLLTPGLSGSKLEQILPYGNTKDAFSRRRQMNKLVIIDKHSQEMIGNTPASYLADALWKWDNSSLKIKNKPFLLKGGYQQWVLTYPMYTSNPNSLSKLNNVSLSLKQINLSFNYEFNDSENEIKQNNHSVNGVTNGDVSDDSKSQSSDSEQPPMRLNNIFHPRPNNEAVPGTALPLIPDRSTKPQTKPMNKPQTNVNSVKNVDTSDEFEKLKLRRKTECSEEMLSIMRNEYNDTIQNFTKTLELKDEENKQLRTVVRQLLPEKPKVLISNDSNDVIDVIPDITVNGNINDSDKRNGIYVNVNEMGDNKENEFELRNNGSLNGDSHDETPNISMSAPKPTIKTPNSLSVNNSSLSRSLSSPNIHQLMAQVDKNELKDRSATNPIPQIDRTLKPIMNREKYNFQESMNNKLRDFFPVHCSGNAITGLKNLGNTCFMSAVIQCLLNTIEFSSFFSNGKFNINKNSKFGSNGELVIELSALFRVMVYPSTYKSISPKDFKNSVSKHIQGFIGFAQQDSHEFLVKLLEKLHEDLNESVVRDVIDTSVPNDLSMNAAANKFWKEHLNKNKSIITQLFEGLFVNTLTCLTCHKTSNTFEPFSCLSLPLSNNRTTLNDCLIQYFKPERMSGEAAWECPTCKQKREADKKVHVWKWPKVLIVHLKRFSYEGVWRQKLQTYVEFPIDRLTVNSLQNESNYSLYGVVNHYGSLEGGHYTAFSQRPSSYRWHRFDDQEVSQMSTADVKTQAAYILFYTSF